MHLLLEARCDVNVARKDGGTALIDASSINATEMVKLLLRHGADVAKKVPPPPPNDATFRLGAG